MNEKAAPNDPRAGTTGVSAGRRGRSAYATPRLEQLGDVRELTLGGSPGAGDSGSPTTKRTKKM